MQVSPEPPCRDDGRGPRLDSEDVLLGESLSLPNVDSMGTPV